MKASFAGNASMMSLVKKIGPESTKDSYRRDWCRLPCEEWATIPTVGIRMGMHEVDSASGNLSCRNDWLPVSADNAIQT